MHSTLARWQKNADGLTGLCGFAQDYFELGVILLRKKLYTQATKNLEKAKKAWTGEPEELAQVRLFQRQWLLPHLL